MPLVFLLVVVVLIAQIGFWDTMSAVLGGVLMILLLIVLLTAIGVMAARYYWLVVRRRLGARVARLKHRDRKWRRARRR